MDVSVLSPFTNVKCPECGEQTRVKCKLGNYELKKRQGVGGMSLVFGAADLTLGREVAIKILNEAYSMDEKRIAEFEKEARITAGISHPHVVRVYTVGQAFGRYYIAMEMVAGGSLEQKMSEKGSLDESEIVSIATQVTEGLQAAQRAGLIHRDIKPGNILFDNQGHAKIVDFGLALVTQGGKAKAEEIWATPYYVPPEALEGIEEDFRGDIYALGASLYHALSGKPPFDQETKSTTALRQIKAELPSLRKAAPWVSEGLCDVIDKCMAFDPMDRYKSYAELLKALKYYDTLAQRTGEATAPVSARAKRRTMSKQASANWMWGAIGAVAVGVGIAYVVLSNNGEEESAGGATVGEVIPASPEVSEAKMKLIAAELSSARSLLKQRNYRAASERLMRLVRDPEVPSETVYWAGVQSAIASWLDGRSADARKALREVRNRQDKAVGELSATDLKLKSATELLMQFRPIQREQLGAMEDDLDKMVLFAAALKNWEQGVWDGATTLFKEFESTKISEDSEALVFYRSLVRDYLHDEGLMRPYVAGFQLENVQAAKARREALLAVEKKIKTRGRAVYNLDSLNHQLSQQIKGLESKFGQKKYGSGWNGKSASEPARKDPQAEWRSVHREVGNLVERLDFAKASEKLKEYEPESEVKKSWREQMIYMTDSGAGFLAAVYRDLKDKGGSYTLLGRDGKTEFKQITGASEDGVEVLNDGQKRLVLWREIEPSSMLGLHNQITRTGLNDFEKRIRLEQAIAYAWLVGEKEKAKTAASKLADESPVFKRRWASCMDILE
ncbi:serine/threonine-protein kinase PknD [Rubritalea halochordaticola]|uniref:Serine/threonine-protein kinase PknD n=1 Tax=Rubritalea halochordaticola TaxID=714537 RepID=A0ABP9V137_9BACT